MCVIDVSQAVEHDHPHAFDFLRKDCTNITGTFLMSKLRTILGFFQLSAYLIFYFSNTVRHVTMGAPVV